MSSLILKRIILSSLTNCWRNKFLSLATVVVMASMLFIFNIIIGVQLVSENIIANLNQKVDIISYLADKSDNLEINDLLNELKSLPEVKEVIYTSKAEALNEVLKDYPEQENPFEKYGLENKLPANIRIISYNPAEHPKIISFLKNGKYSDLFVEISSNAENQAIADQVIRLTKITKKTIFAIVIAYLLGGLLIIRSALDLVMYNRREEIKVMRLVGASFSSIKQPFMIEGGLYGILAVIVSALIFMLFLSSLGLKDTGLNLPIAQLNKIFWIEIIVSCLIGILSSLISIKKYLTEKI